MPARNNDALTNSPRLANNVVWNLVGTVFPLFVGIFTIPYLIRELGVDRFGVLSIAWMVIGYFSLFDLGLGRAVTQLISERLGGPDQSSIPELIGTSLGLMTGFSMLGGLVAWLLVPYLVQSVFVIPEAIQEDVDKSFYILALSIPVVVISSAFRAVLEAYQRFYVLNVIKVLLGIFTFAGPLIVLQISNSLTAVVIALVIARLICTFAYARLCKGIVPDWNKLRFMLRHIKGLISFGGWMTITNIVSPMMVYFDRFFIGAIASVAAVSYYTVPYEIVTKLLAVPTAIAAVLFPALALTLASDAAKSRLLFEHGVKYTFLALLPPVFLIVVFAEPALTIWLGQEFAIKSTPVLQLLAIGVLVNALGYIPFALIQANGRPDITAKIHLIELPFYIVLLWLAIRMDGINGAAVAWVVRVCVDALFLFWFSMRIFHRELEDWIRWILILVGVGIVMGVIVVFEFSIIAKLILSSVILVAFTAAIWLKFLTEDEKAYCLKLGPLHRSHRT